MREHELKTWPEPFRAVLDGRKRYEIRVNDRGFAVGDVLHLRESSKRLDDKKCSAIGCHNDSDPRWFAPDDDGVGRPICDGHIGMPKVWPAGFYTDRSIRVRVIYLTPGGSWGLPAQLCVLSIEPVEERTAP